MLVAKSAEVESNYLIRGVYVGNGNLFTGGVSLDIKTVIRRDRLHVTDTKSDAEKAYDSLEEFYRDWRVRYLVTENSAVSTSQPELVDESEFDKVIYDSLDNKKTTQTEEKQ